MASEEFAPPVDRLILVDPHPPMCSAWRAMFGGYPEVEVVDGRFEQLPRYDCMVAATNCYGIMDGGVDLAIRDRFPGVEARVRERIAHEFHGYQSVGTAIIVESGDLEHPWVVHEPTMRVPMPLVGSLASQVHSAMWATLCAVRRHNLEARQRIAVLACPGLGVGHGRLHVEDAARLMAFAYAEQRREPTGSGWAAARRHEQLLGGGTPVP